MVLVMLSTRQWLYANAFKVYRTYLRLWISVIIPIKDIKKRKYIYVIM